MTTDENDDSQQLVSRTHDNKPDAVMFDTGDKNKFTAVVAVDGQGSDIPEKAEMTSEFLSDTIGDWSGQPVFANHDPRHEIGTVKSATFDDGKLVHTFELEDEKAADIIRNDAFNGFSIGFHPFSTEVNDQGQATNGQPWHLSISLFGNEPVCGKEQCHVLFSQNGTERSCLCNEDIDVDDIIGFQFNKEKFDKEDAEQWTVTWMEEHDCHEGNFEFSDQDDYYEITSPEKEDGEANATSKVEPGLTALVSAPEESDDDTDEKLSLFSIVQTDESEANADDEDERQDGATGDSTMTDDDEPEAEEEADETEDEAEEAEESEEPEASESEAEEEEEVDAGDNEELRERISELEEKAERLENVEEEKQRIEEEKQDLESHLKDNVVEDLPELNDDLREIHGLDEDQNWRALDLEELQKERARLDVYGGLVDEEEEEESSESPDETSVDETVGDAESEETDDATEAAKTHWETVYERKRA